MKSRIVLAISTLVIAAFLDLGLTQANAYEQPAPRMPRVVARASTLNAIVVAVDQQAQTVTVMEHGATPTVHTFTVDPHGAAALTDLRPGDRVSVDYLEAEGKRSAMAITVLERSHRLSRGRRTARDREMI